MTSAHWVELEARLIVGAVKTGTKSPRATKIENEENMTAQQESGTKEGKREVETTSESGELNRGLY